jgi:hypothetical protein
VQAIVDEIAAFTGRHTGNIQSGFAVQFGPQKAVLPAFPMKEGNSMVTTVFTQQTYAPKKRPGV